MSRGGASRTPRHAGRRGSPGRPAAAAGASLLPSPGVHTPWASPRDPQRALGGEVRLGAPPAGARSPASVPGIVRLSASRPGHATPVLLRPESRSFFDSGEVPSPPQSGSEEHVEATRCVYFDEIQ